jgi:uncharacterized membrane protein
MKSIKLALKFWQEIIFIVALGILVFGITTNISVNFTQVFNIVFYCIFVLLLICLIGQLYWKNLILALWLTVILGLGSAYMILAALSDLAKITTTDKDYIYTIFALLLSIGLTVTAISMPFKYFKSDSIQKDNAAEKATDPNSVYSPTK